MVPRLLKCAMTYRSNFAKVLSDATTAGSLSKLEICYPILSFWELSPWLLRLFMQLWRRNQRSIAKMSSVGITPYVRTCQQQLPCRSATAISPSEPTSPACRHCFLSTYFLHGVGATTLYQQPLTRQSHQTSLAWTG